MKTKQMKKVLLIGCVLLVGVAVCVSVWFFLSEHKAMEIQEQSQRSIPNASKAANDETSNIGTPSHDREEPVTRREIIARQSRNMFRSIWSEDKLASPHVQKMLEIMDSPEYAELPSDFSTHEWKDFLESEGVPVTRGNPGVFTKHPPFMSLEEYEPIVRYRMAKAFIAANPVDMTNPEAATILRATVLNELNDAEGSGFRWFLERFGDDWREVFRVHEGMENNPAVIWMTDVQQNAASIVAAAEQARVDALEASAPSWDMSSVMESSSVSSDATTKENPSVSPPAIDALEPSAISKPETDAAVTPAPGLTDVPKTPTNLPTVKGLETSLKEQFSSERFERAMSTLERYGPEEGLRRLKENDPEVAKQIEQHRNRAHSEDSDKSEEISQ